MTTKAKKPRKQALKPQTTPADVEANQYRGTQYISYRQAGVVVNEDTALTLGAVWACVRVISESLAGLPWNPYRNRTDGGRDILKDHPTNWLLDVEPNPETAAFQWRETLVAHALTWGNGFAEIERDLLRRPVSLWQITPDRVEVVRFRGRILYDVANHNEPNSVLEADQMYHMPGLGFDGLVGYPVIRLAARTIGAGIGMEEASSQFFNNDSTPGGVLTTEKQLSEVAINNVRKSWEAMHSGPKNRRKVAILESGLKWEQTGLPPEDAQLLEQRQFTPTEICRWFRVPPHKIADLTRSTNNNIEHQSIEFVNDTLRPWAERLESEANRKLYGRNNQGSIETIIDLNELKRGDMAAQTAFLKETSDRGLLSVNEGRNYLGLNPISKAEGGEKRFVMMNMQVLEKAGEEPVQPEPQPTPTEPTSGLSNLEEDLMPIVEDACRRIIKREKDAKHLEGDALGNWLTRHKDYCRETLAPFVKVLAKVYSKKPDLAASAALHSFIESYAIGPGETDHVQTASKLRTIVIAASAALKGAA
jgi:HK97 family phage portal protein